MKARNYIDFKLGGTSSGVPAPVVAGRLLTILHGGFRQRSGRYAIALPRVDVIGGSVKGNPWAAIRVFADSQVDLERLVDDISGHVIVRDYTRLGFPRQVPEDFDGPWMEYRRYRISSRNAGVDDLRMRRLRYAQEERLPYFQMTSVSNRQRFLLTVAPIAVAEFDADLEFHPDSYGLSTKSREFALPYLPIVR